MNEAPSDSSSEGLDLRQFYQAFFEEAGENLERMERQLLDIDIEVADDEDLNSIFRCAHSVKGGAATFGFGDVAELTHQMETLLDKLRRHELKPTATMVDTLLKAGDVLKAQLLRHQQGGGGAPVDTQELLEDIRAFAAGPAPVVPVSSVVGVAAPAVGLRELELLVGPLDSPATAEEIFDLFREIGDLGSIEPLDGGQTIQGMRRFKVISSTSDSDLIDLLGFHVAREHIQIKPMGGAAAPAALLDEGFGFFDGAPGAPAAAPPAASAPAPVVAPRPAPAGVAAKATMVSSEASTLRVSIEKVDQLINLVGELVITQAMLAQNSERLDPAVCAPLAKGLSDLMRNTRDLQESVMSIRMIPMSVVYSRFPRMLRDLAARLDKKIELVTTGEATEVDKGMVERIADPLTHLVRNACDHGIETPAERRAKGKREVGTLTMAASHQGGSIVIEVRDDGRGLSRNGLLKKARERGIHAPDTLSDSEVWNLIMAPGFSTADVVTDVSGRGVGMDVVRQNITSLGGTVEIDSAEGYGLSVRVRLPLTLAIMDGMSVGVGDEVYILPLASVIESFQVRPGLIRSVGGSGRVVQVRDEYMPVLDLEQILGVPRLRAGEVNGVMVVIEADGVRVALLVDALLGQQQVVVKNLEANYRRVNDVSGATIMGDGRVALILDTASLARRSRH